LPSGAALRKRNERDRRRRHPPDPTLPALLFQWGAADPILGGRTVVGHVTPPALSSTWPMPRIGGHGNGWNMAGRNAHGRPRPRWCARTPRAPVEISVADQIVITGFGAVTPVGNDRETTWRNLVDGRSGIGPISAFDASELPIRIAGEVRGFDPSSILDAKRLRRSARFTHFAVAAAREAVADAGLDIAAEDPLRLGVAINAAVAGFDTIEDATRRLLDPAVGRIGPHFVSSSLTNMPACEVAIDLGIHGPVSASTLACASGLYAFLEARRLILADEADVVVCGGTDAAITPVMFAGLATMGAPSKRNDEPAAASRPFDAERDGFVFCEGAVVAVVESVAHARRRGKVGGRPLRVHRRRRAHL